MLAAYIQSVLSQRPISFWPGGEPLGVTVKDVVTHVLSDSTYDGAMSGTMAPRWPSGLAIGGYGWDFTNGYIQIPDHGEYRPSTGEISLEAWINPDNRTGFQGVISKTSSNKPSPWDTYVTDGSGTFTFITNSGGTDIAAITSTTVPLNRWTHILCRAIQNAAGTAVIQEVYFNGKKQPLSAGGTTTALPAGGTNPVRIGNRNDGGTSMDGKIAFPAIYGYPIDLGPVRERVAMGRGLLSGGGRRGLRAA